MFYLDFNNCIVLNTTAGPIILFRVGGITVAGERVAVSSCFRDLSVRLFSFALLLVKLLF